MRFLAPALLALLLLTTASLYWGGLSSRFLLDDHANLAGLAGLGNTPSMRDLAGYAGSNDSGPSGRPLTMLTFGLQHDAWPAAPFEFKLFNLMLHLLCGALLYLITCLLSKIQGLSAGQGKITALLAAALWLTSPVLVSTVLYTVQRMTILATLFTLLAVLGWLHGRQRLSRNIPLAFPALLLFTYLPIGLGVLCKETAALAPLLILGLEASVLKQSPLKSQISRWMAIALGLPIMGIFIWGGWHFSDLMSAYSMRDFTMTERLMTEPKVLLDYLRLLLLPDPNRLGLFHDDYPVSRGLTVAASSLVIILTVCLGWYLRREYPGLALAIFWFIGGHLLESSVLPLELYFEHRNYLPATGFFIGLALFLQQLSHRVSKGDTRLVMTVMLGTYLATTSLLTWNEARHWSQPLKQAVMWHQEHPTSKRANENLAIVWTLAGDAERAASIYAEMLEMGYVSAGFKWMKLACIETNLPMPDPNTMLVRLQQTRFENSTLNALHELLEWYESHSCEKLPEMNLGRMIDALSANPEFRGRSAHLYILSGNWHTMQRNYMQAIAAFKAAYRINPKPETALFMARVALLARKHDLAVHSFDQAKSGRNRATTPDQFTAELAAFERQLRSLQPP